MSQDVNLIIKQYATFSKLLKFKRVETVQSAPSVISGLPGGTNKVRTPIDVTGIKFYSTCRKGPDSDSEALFDFHMSVINGTEGWVAMSLDAEDTVDLDNMATENPADTPFSYTNDPTLMFLGYYDVVSEKPDGLGYDRLFQGRVYLSKGSTIPPSL